MARKVGGVDTHRIQRSLIALTVTTQKAYQAKLEQLTELAGGEVLQQYKLPVAGEAGGEVGWETKKIAFADTFAVAKDLRSSGFTEPVMTFGYELLSGQPVWLTAHVAGWTKAQSGQQITGASVRVGVFAPGVDTAQRFSAVVHLSFQGFAVPQLNTGDF